MEELLNFDNQLMNINNSIEIEQNNFLESTLGKVLNSALDIGLKAVLPDLIEDEVINIKDAIVENGFSEGVKQAVDSAINTGKSAIGIFTGNFENISQIELAVKKGGLLDKTSKVLDVALNLATQKNMIDKNLSSIIKTGKNSIISSMSDKIEKAMVAQIKSVERIEKYCESWNEAFNNRDLNNMSKALKNIESNLQKTIPLENILKKARTIENLHNIIKNTGDFNISTETMELVKRFN